MKYLIGIIVLTLVFAGTALGSARSTNDVYVSGIWCRMQAGSMLCVKQNGRGYGVAFNRNFVLVQTAAGRKVFIRMQP